MSEDGFSIHVGPPKYPNNKGKGHFIPFCICSNTDDAHVMVMGETLTDCAVAIRSMLDFFVETIGEVAPQEQVREFSAWLSALAVSREGPKQ